MAAATTEYISGGECEIRTHEDREALPVFKTGAFNRSANSPYSRTSTLPVLAPASKAGEL
jgi:hypothetical protein